MEHESFEDAETAALMNERFVCVKVDREERPDVDGLYMEAVVALAGPRRLADDRLPTPEGRPFYGGTYFPPEPRHGHAELPPGARAPSRTRTANRRGDLERQAGRLVGGDPRGERASRASHRAADDGLFSRAPSRRSRAQFDPVHGGFGGAPKFPPASTLEFLLAHADGRTTRSRWRG